MIQRIQSVYLLVVTILLIVCMCTPVGAYIDEDYSVSKFTNLCKGLRSLGHVCHSGGSRITFFHYDIYV